MALPNFGYHLARLRGQTRRSLFLRSLSKRDLRSLENAGPISVSVYALCGENSLPEQVVSIRSFLRHVGVPARYVVVSDGTLTSLSEQALRSIHPCVAVLPADEFIDTSTPECIRKCFEKHPLGKKLAVLFSLHSQLPAVYADSDVLFFRMAGPLIRQCLSSGDPAFYLLDCNTALDERMLDSPLEAENPVNSGFLLLRKPLNWTQFLPRLDRVCEAPAFFSEQTMVHLAMHRIKALQLDPDSFVMRQDDQFIYSDTYARGEIALRHYVSPIRHKFWSR